MASPPKTFYAYRGVDVTEGRARDLAVLEKNEFWFSSPERFNDPFEVRPWIYANPDVRPAREEMKRLASKFMPGASRNERRVEVKRRLAQYDDPEFRSMQAKATCDALAASLRQCSIACFTTTSTDIRMWSYYASKHAGYCLGFSFEEPWVMHSSRTGAHVALWPMEVRYEEEYPALNGYADWEDEAEQEALFDNAVLTKAKEWSGENEWRCIRAGEGEGAQVFPAKSLKQLILGARIDPQYREFLVRTVRARASAVEILQARTAERRFEIILDKTNYE